MKPKIAYLLKPLASRNSTCYASPTFGPIAQMDRAAVS